MDNKVRQCLLGGALGDALGYVIEFMSINEITEKYGSKGIQNLELDKTIGKAVISDDTQMTLFTAEGIINSDIDANVVKYIGKSYIKWYYTQSNKLPRDIDSKILENKGKLDLLANKCLNVQRYPGKTCLVALRNINKYSLLEKMIS